MTRCVLLLLYGGLLHHQNIKCPVGKRACAWVHPHFTFTADCRLNWATFPRFLAPENVLVRPSRILSRSLSPPVALKRGHCREVHALLNIANFVRNLLIFFGKEFSGFKSLKRNFFIIFNPVITAIFFFLENVYVNIKFTYR